MSEVKPTKCFAAVSVKTDRPWADGMAQWVTALAAKTADLSLIPGSYMVEEKN